jgi:tetrahydromethanopterin S-methyltransferase subunit H
VDSQSVPSLFTTRLLEFKVPQEAWRIGNVTVGGQPGVRPTVLIGTIFYHGHDVLLDEDRGKFDAAKATDLIRTQEAFAQRTGNPCILDVAGATPEALERHLEFAAVATNGPLLLDGTTAEVRLAGLEFVKRSGLADRVVYNSIQPEIGEDELRAIRDAGVTAAIVLTYYMADFTTQGRVTAVRELLPNLKTAGVTRLLVDTCVLDLATLGPALSAIFEIKNEFGLPAGAGVHNAIATWSGMKNKMGRQAYEPCAGAAVAAAVAVGADFVLYGPIEDAPFAFPAVAMIDTALSELAMEQEQPIPKSHPRFRIG